MDALEKIQIIMSERRWSYYKLAKETGLSQSTISNMFHRNTIPTIPTLDNICKGFGISLAQFFAEGNMVELTDEQVALFNKWVCLTAEQKKVIMDIINNF
jgi:transcriptional regulator with XRE-family HTH domain